MRQLGCVPSISEVTETVYLQDNHGLWLWYFIASSCQLIRPPAMRNHGLDFDSILFWRIKMVGLSRAWQIIKRGWFFKEIFLPIRNISFTISAVSKILCISFTLLLILSKDMDLTIIGTNFSLFLFKTMFTFWQAFSHMV